MVDDARSLARELERHVRWWQDAGVRQLLVTAPPAAGRAGPAVAPAAVSRSASPGASVAEAPSGKARVGEVGARLRPPEVAPPPGAVAAAVVQRGDGRASLGATLDEVRQTLGECARCGLCQGRANIVFGSGSPRAELVFVGEGPGAEEDAQGQPFVGAAGQLLTKMIEAMTLTRDQVYICNVVKCRPPNNRNPEPAEIDACLPFLEAQLDVVRPKVIIALGRIAAQTLLRDSTAISRLRGQWRTYRGIDLMPTFHPAYLLRTPADKRLAWLDLQEVMKRLGRRPA